MVDLFIADAFKADTASGKYCLNAYGAAPKNGANVTLWTCDPMNSTKQWIVESVGRMSKDSTGDAYYEKGDYIYVIRSKYNRNLVLTAKGTGNKADVRLAPYSNNKEKKKLQHWIWHWED